MQPVPESKRRRAPTSESLRQKMSELISLREKVAQAELATGIARLRNGQGVVTEGELKSQRSRRAAESRHREID
jgi:hypothetical protein